MQESISVTTLYGCRHSIPPCCPSSARADYRLAPAQRSQDGDTPAVPGSPGRARHLRPYPPSSHKRQ